MSRSQVLGDDLLLPRRILIPLDCSLVGQDNVLLAVPTDVGDREAVANLLAAEDWDELVHPSVGEEQVGGVRHQARQLDNRVPSKAVTPSSLS